MKLKITSFRKLVSAIKNFMDLNLRIWTLEIETVFFKTLTAYKEISSY